MTNGHGGPVAPPGWYPDGDGFERRWDGAAWTEDRRPVGGAPAPAAEETIVRPLGPEGGTPAGPAAAPPAEATMVRPEGVAPEDAIWPADPAPEQQPAPAQQPTPEDAIWPADPAAPEDAPAEQPQQPVAPPQQPTSWPQQPAAAPPAWPGSPQQPVTQPPAAQSPAAQSPVGQSPVGQSPVGQPPAPGGYPPPPGQPGAPSGPPPGGTGGAPYGPGGFGYGGPPPAPAKKKSLLWLWVVLAVVLVVVAGSAVALVVTKPWDDSDSSAEGGEGEKGDDGGEGGEDAPSFVTGDVNGDDLGDAVASLSQDGTYNRLTATSDGSAFTVESTPVNGGVDEQLIWDDFDGDGAVDILSWTFDGTLNLRSEDDSIPGKAFELGVWDEVPNVSVFAGDYDGDGDPDLSFVGQSEKEVVSVWVALNNGSGFDDATEWATLPQTSWGSTAFFPGDWDTDGDADLLAMVPDKPLKPGEYDEYYWSGPLATSLLTSDGSALTAGASSPVSTPIYRGDDYAIGAFGDDEAPMIAVEDYSGDVVVYGFDGSALREEPALRFGYEVAGIKGGIEAIVASDVDGDGHDDVVYVTWDFDKEQYEGFHVARSSGTEFSEPERWAETPECKDFCLMRFQQGS